MKEKFVQKNFCAHIDSLKSVESLVNKTNEALSDTQRISLDCKERISLDCKDIKTAGVTLASSETVRIRQSRMFVILEPYVGKSCKYGSWLGQRPRGL